MKTPPLAKFSQSRHFSVFLCYIVWFFDNYYEICNLIVKIYLINLKCLCLLSHCHLNHLGQNPAAMLLCNFMNQK